MPFCCIALHCRAHADAAALDLSGSGRVLVYGSDGLAWRGMPKVVGARRLSRPPSVRGPPKGRVLQLGLATVGGAPLSGSERAPAV